MHSKLNAQRSFFLPFFFPSYLPSFLYTVILSSENNPQPLTNFFLCTGFSCYPKVECSYENFHKPKWCKAKKQLWLIYLGNFWAFPDLIFNICTMSLFHSPWSKHLTTSSFTLSITPFQALSGFSATLGHTLLTNAQNKWRWSLDTHSSKLWYLMFRCWKQFPGKEFSGAAGCLACMPTLGGYFIVLVFSDH